MKRDDFTMHLGFANELIIDNFAGGGGTSTGLEAAFGRPVDIAINHDAQVRMCGNSVCPPMSEALVRANFSHEAAFKRIAA